ncbi:hypothetical protein C2G38_2075187 [Gigaspora rosea]|uniref:Peptidase S1 domain-containing protein n=1 Tax=Gigaspora rosea TaxID=44941 RepID=A0A397VMQ7_9GLOM|nr:hypothetical protein C2G38_2075187 [Gigaspora rosea]
MNKKSSLYLALIAMIVIPSIASVISQRNNISNTLVFRTSQRIKGTSRFNKRNKGNKARGENKLYSQNAIISPFNSVVDPNHNYPIGLILYADGNQEVSCTASVINTANGNIGLTAAHCLFDDNSGEPYDQKFLSFSPGYDNGTNGPLGAISVVAIAVPYVDPENNDYALVRFEFDDPNGEYATLQEYTGALGWRFDIGDYEQTSVFGYPEDGGMEGCVRDGRHLCKWQYRISGITHAINNIDFGEGACGGPFITQYEAETNLGYVYAIYSDYIVASNVSFGDIWDEDNFFDLLLRVTP